MWMKTLARVVTSSRAAREISRARVEEMVRRLLGVSPERDVLVREFECADPNCQGSETVVLIYGANEPTDVLKIKCSLAEVTEQAVQFAQRTREKTAGGEGKQ